MSTSVDYGANLPFRIIICRGTRSRICGPLSKSGWRGECRYVLHFLDLSWTCKALLNTMQDSSPYLGHKDVFAQYISPRMRKPRFNWDNECGDDRGTCISAEDCRSICDSMEDCLQYSYSRQTHICKTSVVPRLGQAGSGVQSGWVLSRVEQYAAALPPCGDEGWIV